MKNVKAWRKYCKSGEKPADIPVNPDREYKTEWVSWGDWLGTNVVASQKRQYLPFEEARRYVQSFRLTSGKEFKNYMKKTMPLDIPSAPWRVYKEWKGMNDWLGTEISRYTNRKFLPFKNARKYVRRLGLKTEKEWRYCRSGNLPSYIPTNPAKKYKEDWINIGDWLGTGNIGNKDRKFLPFSEARKYVRRLGLPTVSDWESYCKSGKLPPNIPTTPQRTYANKGWKGFGDWELSPDRKIHLTVPTYLRYLFMK